MSTITATAKAVTADGSVKIDLYPTAHCIPKSITTMGD